MTGSDSLVLTLIAVNCIMLGASFNAYTMLLRAFKAIARVQLSMLKIFNRLFYT